MPVNGWILRAAVAVLAAGLGCGAGPAPAGASETARAPVGGEVKNFNLFKEPRPVAAIPFKDGAGRDLDLGAFKGRVVLVNLWATWCVPCREEMPALDRLQAELGGPDFQVVAVSQDRAGSDKVRAFLADIGAKNLPLYLDVSSRTARAWGAVGLPTTFLLDRDGREVGRLVGPAAWDSEDAKKLIRHFIGTKPVTKAAAR